MAYVGTPIDTQNQFQSLQGKRFSGDASTTAFTLDVAPSSVFDIEVFVENVRQDPNSAYSLSGTTLTFSAAPSSGTNNIYVIHQAKAVGTIEVLDSAITTAKINDNAVSFAKLDSTNQSFVKSIPQSGSAKTSSYTLTTSDIGSFIEVGSSGAITIPNSTFSAGNAISLFNNTTGNITVTCSITTAYIAGTNTDKSSVTLATRGVATILFISGTVCVISGNVS
jgi:hypothetical protein